MKKYVVAYINRIRRVEWPRSKTIEAENAQDARRIFDEWYWTDYQNRHIAHPFHITVKRLDGLSRCPLCDSELVGFVPRNSTELGLICNNKRCELQIKLKAK